jgi:glycine hydroxymethyltransferase
VSLRVAQSEAFRERQRRTVQGARIVADELLDTGHGVSVLTAVSSGLRAGTPALATRGLQSEDFAEVR